MKEQTRAWLEFAARDIEAARKLAESEYLANIVLFHSQQCVEKCLKALLEEHSQNVPKIHGVNRLHNLLAESTGIALPVTADELDLIDDVYIDTRYPGSFGLLQSGLPSKEQAISLLEIAEKIHEAVCKKLSS
jgi:HEPN domain-containing protein